MTSYDNDGFLLEDYFKLIDLIEKTSFKEEVPEQDNNRDKQNNKQKIEELVKRIEESIHNSQSTLRFARFVQRNKLNSTEAFIIAVLIYSVLYDRNDLCHVGRINFRISMKNISKIMENLKYVSKLGNKLSYSLNCKFVFFRQIWYNPLNKCTLLT